MGIIKMETFIYLVLFLTTIFFIDMIKHTNKDRKDLSLEEEFKKFKNT